MDWQIDIPDYFDDDELVLDTISAAREKFGRDDQRTHVVEAIANDAFFNRSILTVGELLDELDGLDQPETRRRLDWAREKAGLLSATEIEVAARKPPSRAPALGQILAESDLRREDVLAALQTPQDLDPGDSASRLVR